MRFLKNSFRFIKGIFIYIFSLFILSSYLCWIYSLKSKGILDAKDFINNLTIFIGWILALLIGFIHLQKTRRDNLLAKKEEIKKRLEIDAFREINKAVTEFSDILSSVGTPYITLPAKLKLHIEKPLLFKFNKVEINMQLTKEHIDVYKGITKFVLAIEANEIAVVEFDHYRKFIQLRVEDLHTIINGFLNYFNNTPISTLVSLEGYAEFKRKSTEVHEKIMDVSSFLFDYRIELMNSILKEIFYKEVPERKPRDPKYKTLKQLSIKKDVEKECELREIRAMSTSK